MPVNDIIFVVVDTLRKDHVGYYGDADVDTGHINELASDSVAFHSAHPEALPTIPIRNSLFTGRRTLPHMGYGPLPEEEVPIQSVFGEYGYTTGLVTDNYHYAKPGMNHFKAFDSYEVIRGQDGDSFRPTTGGQDVTPYVKPEMEGSFAVGQLRQYFANVEGRDDDPESYFAGRVFSNAIEWLERTDSADGRFLWVDSFDPHEPWDPPAPYRGRHTDPSYDGPDLIYPKYGATNWLTDEELRHVRGRYAEEVEYVDDQFGRFLEYLRRTGHYEESLIVFVGDHGMPLGEHGDVMKMFHALYSELVDIPLLVKPPKSEADKYVSDTHHVARTDDVVPTVLDMLGAEHETHQMAGESLLPAMVKDEPVRDHVVTGYHRSEHRVLRTPAWSYLLRPSGQPDELYDLDADPGERRNLIRENEERASELRSKIPVSLIQSKDEPLSDS